MDQPMRQEREFMDEAIRHRSPDVQRVDIIDSTVVYTHIYDGIVDVKTYTFDGDVPGRIWQSFPILFRIPPMLPSVSIATASAPICLPLKKQEIPPGRSTGSPRSSAFRFRWKLFLNRFPPCRQYAGSSSREPLFPQAPRTV